MYKTILFQVIQFNISTKFSSIWSIDRALSGATTLGQSGPLSDGSKRILCIPQSSSITGTSPIDCLVSYPGHLLGSSYPSAEVLSAYSTAVADWTMFICVLIVKIIYCVIVEEEVPARMRARECVCVREREREKWFFLEVDPIYTVETSTWTLETTDLVWAFRKLTK